MQEVVILSDLWGTKKSEWLLYYQEILSKNYKVKFYDSCELGQVDLTNYEQRNIHDQFIAFGIENAVNKLLDTEQQPKIYIGCSIGGVILWKASLQGLPIEKLVTISATRLRKESKKPLCPVKMYFGELDGYQPASDWFILMGVDANCTIRGNHDIYKEKSSIVKILENLNEEKWIDLQ